MATVSKPLGCSPFYALYKQEPRLATFQNATPAGTTTAEVTNFMNSLENDFKVLREMIRDNTLDAKDEAATRQYNKTAGIVNYAPGQIVY